MDRKKVCRMKESWLPVVGYEGQFEVSDLGRVRGLDRVIEMMSRTRSGKLSLLQKNIRGRVLRPGPRKSGHLTVVLSGKTHNVHLLVLRAFVGLCPSKMEGRHLNGEHKNNTLSNLEYNTRRQNTLDRKWHKGTKRCKLTPTQVL